MIVIADTTPLNYLVLIARCDRNARGFDGSRRPGAD